MMKKENTLRQKVLRLSGAACIAALSFVLLAGCGAEENNKSAENKNDVTTPVEQQDITPLPTDTPLPSPTVTPAPTPRPAYGVTMLSLYKNYKAEGARKKINGSFESEWIQGQDISSFEAIASDTESISTDGRYFQDLWKAYWEPFENHEDCKIGYYVRFDLKSGETVSKTILVPEDVEDYKNYIENYLYDDIHQVPGQWYSHLLDEEVNEETVITSIKFTAGKDIAEVEDEILLTAFVYYSDDDFDDEGNYIGDTSCTIKIKNTAQE